MRLTLDIDKKSASVVFGIYNKLEILFPQVRKELWKSAKGKGWHIVIYNTQLSWDQILKLRRKFGDDPKRIKMDRNRWKQGICCQVLFHSKGKLKAKRII